MKNKKRNGFALIYTVLISALVLISIVGLTIKAVPENVITKARTHSQRALSVAEAGASKVLFDLRNFSENEYVPESGASHYLWEGDIINLIDGNSLPNLHEEFVEINSYKTSYKGKVKIINRDEDNQKLDVELYMLGTVYDNEKVLARKAIKTSFLINYDIREEPIYETQPVTKEKWVEGTKAGIFDYALYSGSDILFGGSAQTVTGSIHAVGTINLGTAKNQVRVGGGGDAEAEGNITGKGIVTGEPITGADPVPFPEINIDAYKGLADAFRSGTAPYDGTNLIFPKVSNPIELSIIQSYLGAPGTSSTLTGVNNFYHDLINKTGAFAGLDPSLWLDLKTHANSIVYYIQGDVHINGQFECIGTLVIDGNLVINGNSQIGNPNDPGAAAILVKGDIDLSNGTADLYGLFYSTGSLRGSGTFYCEGSIATKGTIDVRGNYTVDYHEITNPNLGISHPGHYETYTTSEEVQIGVNTYYSVTSAAGYDSAGSDPSAGYLWEETSFDDFEGVH